MVTRWHEGWKLPLALTGAATVLFYIGVFLVQPLLSAVILRMPENYEYLARSFVFRGDYHRAIQACQREITGKIYNFHAHYLLAEILHRAGRGAEALELLWDLPERYRAVLARNVPSRGWDEAYLHLLLSKVLWDLGRPEESLDQLQVAWDHHDPKVDIQCGEFVSTMSSATTGSLAAAWSYVARALLEPKFSLERVPAQMIANDLKAPPNFYTRLAQIAANRNQLPTAQRLDSQETLHHPQELPSLLAHGIFPEWRSWPGPNEFMKMYVGLERLTIGRFDFDRQTNAEVCLAEWYWAHLFRTTVVTGKAVLSRKSRGICIVARGTVCDNVWPILSIRVNGKTIGQRYLCTPFYQVYTLPLQLEAGSHSIGVGFENDASNPITKRDRNLEIREIRFY